MFNIFYGWYIVFACFFIGMYVAGTIFFGFTAYVEPIIREFGWSYTQVSMISALRGLNMGIFAPIAGYLVDRFGSRKVIIFGVCTMATGLISLGHTDSLLWFFGSFLLLSLGAGGCTSVVLMSVVANWFDKKAGKAMGLAACGFGAGGLIVPLNVYLIEAYGWRNAMIIAGISMLSIGLPLSAVIRNHPEQYGCLPDGEIVTEKSKEQANIAVKTGVNLSEAVKSSMFVRLALVEAARMMVVASVAMHIMPFLESIGYDRPKAGLIAAAVPLLSIIGRLGFGWLGDVIDKRKTMALSLLMMTFGTAALAYLHLWLLTPFFLLLYSPGFGGNTTMRAAVIREYFGTAAFGRLIGIVMGLSSIGGLLGPVLSGWVFDSYGSYQPIWLAYTLLLAACITLILHARR